MRDAIESYDMKLMLILTLAIAAAAGPAAAEFGKAPSPSGFQKPTTGAVGSAAPAPYRPAYDPASTMSKPKIYSAPPAAPAYKPYAPYKSQSGTSVFGPDAKKKR